MPSPRADEDHDDFIERCMADDEAVSDFPDPSQRRAFCESQWDQSRRSRSSVMETKSIPFECKVNTEKREVEGYAATWDRDEVDDIILPGAFKRTIDHRGDRIKALWQHMDAVGRPLQMEEDQRGLFTRSKISKTTLGDDALTLMADGVVDSMSIGFTIPDGKAEFEADGWTRRIKEVKLFEYSFVTFPANEEAVITGLKQLHESARRHGRDAFGHKEAELRAVIENIEALLDGRDPPHGTRDRQHSPGDIRPDPDADIKAALHSLGHQANEFATITALRNMR